MSNTSWAKLIAMIANSHVAREEQIREQRRLAAINDALKAMPEIKGTIVDIRC